MLVKLSKDEAHRLAARILDLGKEIDRLLGECVTEEEMSGLFWAEGPPAYEYRSRCHRLIEHIGLGEYRGIRVGDDVRSSAKDTYLLSAIEEMDLAFEEVVASLRVAVVSGSALAALEERYDELRTRPIETPDGREEWQRLWFRLDGLAATFWRSAVTVIVNECRFWDRAAQLLSYVFFNIREFDHDVFPTVVRNLSKNVAKDEGLFREHGSWRVLRAYLDDQASGYEVLSSRRNALTHSVSIRASHLNTLRPHTGTANTLERKRLARARQDEPMREIAFVLYHGSVISRLRGDVIGLCLFGIESLGMRPQRFDKGLS